MNDYRRHIPQTILITGATGDFGKAFAARFAALGCQLILHGRVKSKTDALCQQYCGALPLIFDMVDSAAMKDALESLPGNKNIDLLINNAGLALGLDRADDADLKDWETMIEVNVMALARMTRLVCEGMAQRGRGHIINIGSTAGNYPYRGGSVYGATKAFVKQFSLGLRADFAGRGIRVTNLEPAQVETQFSLQRFKGDAERARKVYAGTESLRAEDVAESAVWAATLPPHVNINRIEIMPTGQYPAGLAFERPAS